MKLIFSLILLSVSCSAVAQVILKIGMSQPTVAMALNGGQMSKIAASVIKNYWVVSGLGLYFASAILWLFVLARVEVSFAYPFVGLGFILTLLLGWFIMGDNITLSRILGTVLVSIGVLLIARQ